MAHERAEGEAGGKRGGGARPADQPNTAAAFVAAQLALGKKANRLLQESSPYLLQHAFNPVEWYPWGEEALAAARRQGKVIFLSIGYSTCHWCRVMAAENFEDEETAVLLNRDFIAIKVDREERPDLDQIYMAATQTLSGGGGWPMSVFLTPDRQPFYAGTYFPPRPKYGQPGFREILREIQRVWQEDHDHVLQVAERLTAALQRPLPAAAGGKALGEAELQRAFRRLQASYDRQEGGFGEAPKFPRAAAFAFLLRHYQRRHDQQALAMVSHSLAKIAAGGVHDQLGGGFHRYAVDGQWRLPHFEKMLYDQAQLAIVYIELQQLTGEPAPGEVARRILDYTLRDLQSAEGGFYSAEDADSPRPENPATHGEGAFYLWRWQEIVDLLPAAEAEVFLDHYGVRAEGNAPSDPHGDFVGLNILYVAASLAETAKKYNRSLAETRAILDRSCQLLLASRRRRPSPHLDDKIVTSWNGLMVSALARAYQVFGAEEYIAAAEKTAIFLSTVLYEAGSGLLHHRYRAGQAGVAAQLEDYAFLIQGLLDLYESGFDSRWLRLAITLSAEQTALFRDPVGGGFFETSGQDKSLLVRMKGEYDGATPTGNSVAALNFLRLAAMSGSSSWQEQGVATIAAFANQLRGEPLGLPQLLLALDFSLQPPRRIVVAGHREAEDTVRMRQAINRGYRPDTVLLLAEPGGGLAAALPFLAGYPMVDGKATAYLCAHHTCQPPVTEVAELLQLLAAS